MSEVAHDHDTATCNCLSQPTACQSLDEMEFERGPWKAAMYGDIWKIKNMIESGTYVVDQMDSAGYTPIHYAARSGHLDVVQYLVEQEADVDFVTRAGKATALHRACTTGKLPVVEYLLSRKADVTLQDSDGKTALHRALENGHEDIAELLLKIHPGLKDIPDNKGAMPHGDEEIEKMN